LGMITVNFPTVGNKVGDSLLKKLEIRLRPGISAMKIREAVAGWARLNDAEVKPMGRLVRPYKTSGENIHWHIRGSRKGMGTIEVTYLPSSGELSVLVHDNRQGHWAGQAYVELARRLEKIEF